MAEDGVRYKEFWTGLRWHEKIEFIKFISRAQANYDISTESIKDAIPNAIRNVRIEKIDL